MYSRQRKAVTLHKPFLYAPQILFGTGPAKLLATPLERGGIEFKESRIFDQLRERPNHAIILQNGRRFEQGAEHHYVGDFRRAHLVGELRHRQSDQAHVAARASWRNRCPVVDHGAALFYRRQELAQRRLDRKSVV